MMISLEAQNSLNIFIVVVTLHMCIMYILIAIMLSKIYKIQWKEQEPKKPWNIRRLRNEYIGNCPDCQRVVRFAQRYCHNCRLPLDWTEVLKLPFEDDEDNDKQDTVQQ